MTAPIQTKAALTAAQSARKAELELIVAQHITSFRLAGEALGEILSERLYLDEYDTFADYMADKWGVSERRGYQLVESAETAKLTEQFVHIGSEGAARALSGLTPDQKVRVAKRVGREVKKSGRKVTAKIIDAEVVKVAPRGGLAAAAMQARNTGATPDPAHDIEVDLSPASKSKVVRIIQEWYGQERNRLNEYPPCTPARVVELITRLFQ